MRQSRIENELEQIRELPYAEVIECMPKGLSCITKWILWVTGSQGTLWDGGLYPIQITFPEQYPRVAPYIRFEKSFLHIHVYEGGNICMPILQREYWKSKTTMPDLIQRIVNLIHQEVNPFSPANSSLYQLYKEDSKNREIGTNRKIQNTLASHVSTSISQKMTNDCFQQNLTYQKVLSFIVCSDIWQLIFIHNIKTVRMFKPKSPLGKQNSRIGIFMNEYEKSGTHSQYPNPPSPFSQNLMKTKKMRQQITLDQGNYNLPTFNNRMAVDLNLECDEILEQLHQQPKKISSKEQQQNTLFCEEELENVKSNDWKMAIISRMQKVLRAYQERAQNLQRQNSYLKDQIQKDRQIHYYNKKQY